MAGLEDIEMRYATLSGLIANPESRKVFIVRSRSLRRCGAQLKNGVSSMETPMMQPLMEAPRSPVCDASQHADIDLYRASRLSCI